MTGGFGAMGSSPDGHTDSQRSVLPMQVGNSTLYVEATGPSTAIEPVGGFQAVGLDPTEAFTQASDALRECVRIVGERLDKLGEAVKPDEVGVEFAISFDVEGSARIIPVLLTGKAKTAMGLKVTAKWRPGDASAGAAAEPAP